MAELQTYLEHNDPNMIIWRKGTPEDPYKPRSDSLPVINNQITLLEIPSYTDKVRIAGFVEVSQELFKKKTYLDEHEFLVNYANGNVQFHPSQEGRSLLCTYKGKGLIMYPASRIYAMVSKNPDIVVTLQDYVDGLKLYTENLDVMLLQINQAIENAVNATDQANQATDNAQAAATNANQAAQEAYQAAESTIVIRKDPVNAYDDLAIVYPNPENGWEVTIQTTGDFYRYDGVYSHTWQLVGNYLGGSIPYVSETSDGLLRQEKYRDFITRTIIFHFPQITNAGIQSTVVQFPFDGEIVNVSAFCLESGITAPLEISVEQISSADFDAGGSWSNIFSTNALIHPGEKKGTPPIIYNPQVSKGDYFRIYTVQLDNSFRGITIQIEIKV